jgi:hypothetical protein
MYVIFQKPLIFRDGNRDSHAASRFSCLSPQRRKGSLTLDSSKCQYWQDPKVESGRIGDWVILGTKFPKVGFNGRIAAKFNAEQKMSHDFSTVQDREKINRPSPENRSLGID